MSRQRHRQAHRDWTAAWLGGAAALLLALAAAMLSQVHEHQLQRLRTQAAQTRAQLMAQSIAQTLTQATAAGIPLHRLVGVTEFLERWHGTHPEVTQILVQDLEGRLIWRSQGSGPAPERQLSVGHADVAPAGTLQAHFVETSAEAVDIAAQLQVRTDGGHWLIDSVDITIDEDQARAIQTAIETGDVTVSTSHNGTNGTTGGTDKGDIHVNANIAYAKNQLTLNADNSIFVNAKLSVNGDGKLALNYGGTAAGSLRAQLSWSAEAPLWVDRVVVATRPSESWTPCCRT